MLPKIFVQSISELTLTGHSNRYRDCARVEVQIYLHIQYITNIFFVLLLVFSSLLVQALLREHANDDPKLSYTGQPIVKWPERVSRDIFLHPSG